MIEVCELAKRYGGAVDGLSFTVRPGLAVAAGMYLRGRRETAGPRTRAGRPADAAERCGQRAGSGIPGGPR